jgi:STE24 endopeptidase
MNEDKAARYHRLKRRIAVVSLAWSAFVLAGLLWTGSTLTLRSAAESAAARLSPRAWLEPATVLFYVVFLSLLNEAGGVPIAFYSGWILERRYGLSTERLRGWVVDQLKAFLVGTALAAAGASIVYWLIRAAPHRWWLPAAALFALFMIVLAKLAPVVLLPIFYRVKPLERESLRARLLTLAERAGARVLGAYELGLGDKTRKANAALTGIGSTRRILVSDTMLADYSDEEIEVVLAHELAHHVHGDIWKGIVFESALVLVGFYLAARALSASVGALGLRNVADVAGLPVLLIAAGAVGLATAPAAHAMSRAFERSADRFALELTRNPGAFMSAMRRLGAQNLAEEHPSKIVQWLFYSHPPIRERLEAAQAFASGR